MLLLWLHDQVAYMRKHGERRADGSIFWGYSKNKMKERVEAWVTEEAFVRCKKRNNASHKKSPSKNRQKVKAWSANYPDRVAERRDRRLGRIKSNVDLSDTDKQRIRMIYKICRRITKCLGVPHHVDHIVPLYRNGLHHPNNLQILPAKLNLEKGYRLTNQIVAGSNLVAYGNA